MNTTDDWVIDAWIVDPDPEHPECITVEFVATKTAAVHRFNLSREQARELAHHISTLAPSQAYLDRVAFNRKQRAESGG